MTVLNFPASPSNGQTYTENGVVYTWNGSYWSANNASDLGNIYVAIAGDRMTGQLELPGGGGDTEALQRQEVQLLIDAGGGGGGGPTDLYWERDAGALSPKVSTDNVDIGDGKIQLNSGGDITAEKSVQTSVFNTSANNGQGCRIGNGVVQSQRRSDTAAPYTDVYRGYYGPTLTSVIKATGEMQIGGTLDINDNGTNNVPNITLAADGSADFATDIDCGDIQSAGKGAELIGSLGICQVRNDSGTSVNTAFSALVGDYNIDNTVFRVTYDGDVQSLSQNGGQLAGFRNQIINGDFRIWQRGNGPWDTAFVYTADRWRKNSNIDNGVEFTKYTTLSQLPEGFIAGIRCAHSSTAGNSGGCLQAIELPALGVAGPFVRDSKWTLSLWCDQDITGKTASVRFGDRPGNNVVLAGTVGTFVSTGETSNSFTRYFLNIDIGSAVPNTTNTQFEISLAMHSQLSTTCIYTGVQLEPGPVATPFEHRPIQTELALCQRYYQTCDNLRLGSTDLTTASREISIPRFVTMRADPTETGTPSASMNSTTYIGTANNLRITGVVNTTSQGAQISNYTADAEL